MSIEKFLLYVLATSLTMLSAVVEAKPVATILSPIKGTKYYAGDTFSFSGSATDSSEGDLGKNSFSWLLWFHHENHWHDAPPFVEGAKEGSFSVASSGETSANVYYRLLLIVMNFKGEVDTAYVDIHPYTAIINVNTIPPGLQGKSEVQFFTTPFTYNTVQNLEWVISVDSVQSIGPDTYIFDHWEDGNKENYLFFTMPRYDTTVTAYFRQTVAGVDTRVGDNSLINFYPNPTQSNLYLKYKSDGAETSISIYNVLSQEKKRFVLKPISGENLFELDLSDMDKGIYYVNVSSAKSNFINKIIVE